MGHPLRGDDDLPWQLLLGLMASGPLLPDILDEGHHIVHREVDQQRPHIGAVGVPPGDPLVGEEVPDARNQQGVIPDAGDAQLREQRDLEQADLRPVQHPLPVREHSLHEREGAEVELGQEVLLK